MENLDSLYDAMLAHGLTPPKDIEQGKLIRFSDNGKPGDKAAWVLLFPDRLGAVFGSWRGGWSDVWQAHRTKPMSDAERVAFRETAAKAKAGAETARKADYAAIAVQARKIWEAASPAPTDHPYLVSKGITADGLRVAQDGRLLFPVHGPDDSLQSLQYIASDGSKMFLYGGKMAGGRFTIQHREDGSLVLVEGVATGKSVAASMPVATVVACFTAGNLMAVARDLRGRHPGRNIIIAGDDDTETNGNPGRTKAEAAAKEVDAQAIFPPGGGDWNDHVKAHGIQLTADALAAAIKPPKRIFTPIADLLANPRPVDWLIKHYIPRKAVIVLLGQPGRGKTYLALDWACHIATGRTWTGNKVKESATVLYIAGEGQDAIQRRLAAWHTMLGGLHVAPLSVSKTAIHLNDPNAFAKMNAEIEALPKPPALLVVDTVARCLVGDENGPEAMSGFVAAMDKIKETYGCAVIALHHPSKANPTDPRGHSSLLGAIDATFLLQQGGDDGTILLLNTKQRGGMPSPPIAFKFRSVELPQGYRDPDEPNVSVWESVLEQADMPVDTADDPEKGLKDKQRLALAVLRRLVAEAERNLVQNGSKDSIGARVEIKVWRDATKQEGIEAKHFARIAKSLADRGIVVMDGTLVRLQSEESSNHQIDPNGVFEPSQGHPPPPNPFRVWEGGSGSGPEMGDE
ncbi:AAA family ATPase [Acidithiobacillus sp. MC6.1]|nr:AAA family ATPase [Acidithiobacillus sp. MC6.1]